MSSKKVKGHLKKCNEAIAAGDFDRALTEVESALFIESENYTANIFKGKIYTEQKKFHGAENIYHKMIESEPEKLLAYRGLAAVYQTANQFDNLLEINAKMVEKFGEELGEKREAIIFETMELATNVENWEIWFTVFNTLDRGGKLKTVQNFWERIPFRVLDENQITDLIPNSKSKTFTVFNLWKFGNVSEDFIPDDLLENYKFETDSISEISNSHPLGKLCELFTCQTFTSSKVRKNVVAARQILQAVEKYQFIMQKKNLCGRDIGENFVLFFRPNELIFVIRIFILEICLFLDEDLFTAKDVLNTCDGPVYEKSQSFYPATVYDVYRLKLKYSTGKLDVSDVDWILGISDPKPPAIIEKFNRFNRSRSTGVKCDCLIHLRLLDPAEELLAEFQTETAEKLKLSGIIKYYKKSTKEAQKSLLKSAKLCDTDWETFYYLGKLYLSTGDETRGVKCLRKSCSIKNTVKNVELVCQYLSAEETLQLLDQNLTGASYKPFFQFRRGLSYMELDRYHEAVRIFQKLSRNTENPVYFECLAEAYAHCGSISTAVKTLLKTLELPGADTAHVKYRCAQLLQESQQYSTAREMLEELAESGDFGPAIVGLAECHLMEARHYADEWLPQLAYKHIEKLLDLCRNAFDLGYGESPMVWKIAADGLALCESFHLAELRVTVPPIFSQSDVTVLSREEALKLSIACFSKVVNLLPESPLAWSDISLAYQRCEREMEAIYSGKKAIELTTESACTDALPELWNNLGLVAMKSDKALAQHAFVQAVTLNKEHSNAWSNLGLLYLKEGNLKLSNQAFTKAQAADPENSTAWAGQAHVAEQINHHELTDLFRHSAELINKPAANGHAYHIAKQLTQYDRRNIIAALTNIQRLRNNMDLDEHQGEIIAVLAEHLQLYNTAAAMWTCFPTENRIMRLNAARVLAKQSKVDEALAILAEFDNCENEKEQKMIGHILTLLNQYELAAQYFSYVQEPDGHVMYAHGISAIKAGDLDQGKLLLFNALHNGTGKVKQQAVGALGAFAYLADDSELMAAVIAEVEKMPKNDENSFLLTDLKVRLAVIEGDIKSAVNQCARQIRINPASTFYRQLLAKLLLKCDPGSSVLPAVIIPELSDSLELHPLSQLSANGKTMSTGCFKSAMSARHKQPWNLSIKTSFAASIDHEISAKSMTLPNGEIDTKFISKLQNIQEKYFHDIAEENDENEKLKIWALCGLMRLSNSATSDISKHCFDMLEELDEDLHLRVIATIATIAHKDDKLSIGDIDLTVSSVVEMLESNNRTVPEWLPMLLGVKASADKLPELALQCFLLPINGVTSRVQSYNVLAEAIRILQSTEDGAARDQWSQIGNAAINGLSKFNAEHPITKTMQGILYHYGGDHVRSCATLAKILKSDSLGLWRSVARYYLAKFYKENSKNAKKLTSLFESTDKNDLLFNYSKSLFV